jgi:hypothetical protein
MTRGGDDFRGRHNDRNRTLGLICCCLCWFTNPLCAARPECAVPEESSAGRILLALAADFPEYYSRFEDDFQWPTEFLDAAIREKSKSKDLAARLSGGLRSLLRLSKCDFMHTMNIDCICGSWN